MFLQPKSPQNFAQELPRHLSFQRKVRSTMPAIPFVAASTFVEGSIHGIAVWGPRDGLPKWVVDPAGNLAVRVAARPRPVPACRSRIKVPKEVVEGARDA